MVPEGWKLTSLKEACNNQLQTGPFGSQLHSHEYVDEGIPVLMPKDLNDFRANIETAAKITEERGRDLKKHRLQKGDILFSRRGDVARFALIDEQASNAICGTGCLRVRASDQYYPKYLSYFLQLHQVRKWLEQNSVGQTMPNMNTEILGELPLKLATNLKEQKKIAQILSTWDKAITTTEQLLANSQQQKKALMQQLLTGKKRLLDDNGVRFSGEWKRVELGQLLDYKQPTPYLVKSTNYSNDFKTPVLTAGKTFILGYTDETDGVYDVDFPVVIFDDFTTACKFVDFPFKAKSSALKILTAKPNVNIKYVFEAMQMLNFIIGGHQRHWISIFSNLVISLPDKKEQQKIAAVLTSADQEIESLEQKIDALKQEKKALMQQLLTGKRRVKP
ncbi:restriction endonuclease subunit S [Thiopseudomonas alkaliphila]|uniref:restriction endonuclease subunit S n=1 Tax=Thiopseudomonas alkaliphila TaxID=1697053 RepID=UPI003570C897